MQPDPFDKPVQIRSQPSFGEARQRRGLQNYHSGHAGEVLVARDYEKRGAVVLARNWRGKSGEIDLILKAGSTILFVEVKTSKTHELAAQALTDRQMRRVAAAAEEYLTTCPDGLRTPAQIDAALVDRVGRIERIENLVLH